MDENIKRLHAPPPVSPQCSNNCKIVPEEKGGASGVQPYYDFLHLS
jgi:hypothetical protein